jgi:hypothetical protein
MAQARYIWIAEADDYAEGRFLERIDPLTDERSDVTLWAADLLTGRWVGSQLKG